METGVIATLIAAGVPIFLAIIGGIIWVVREFGKVNSRLSLLEQSVKVWKIRLSTKVLFNRGKLNRLKDLRYGFLPINQKESNEKREIYGKFACTAR